MNITINLTPTQELALTYAETDVEFLMQSSIEGRANAAVKQITSKVVEHCLAEGVQIPASELEIVQYGFDNGIVKTAAERSQQSLVAPTLAE
jgi:hypothetical protein